MKQQRTYWHLDGLGRVPSDYDIGTTSLLYYPERGFEVATPGADWYRRHQQGWWLQLGGCQSFKDPRETTYARYTELQKEHEAYVDRLFHAFEETAYDSELPSAWLTQLDSWLPVLRYPCHALQMLAAYVGQMAPASRVVVACCFQAADEMRRIQRIAYRMRQLQDVRRGFGTLSKKDWEHAAPWQPLRALIERLLVTYDAGSAFVGLNLVLKPMFDRLFMQEFASLADQSRDVLFSRVLASLEEDCRWHRQWVASLVRVALAGTPELAAALQPDLQRWHELAGSALDALEPLWTAETRSWSVVQHELRTDCIRFWEQADLIPGGGPT
jgi:toluene monooxygenase system protein E